MQKYSKQLADIYNDDNRFRNFKTIMDQFKDAKKMNTFELGQLTSMLKGVVGKNRILEGALAGSGAKVLGRADMDRIAQERKRGPK